jgi:hypothetical protein
MLVLIYAQHICVIEIVYKIIGFRWGNLSHIRHASGDIVKWKKCNSIQHSAEMPKILVVLVVDQAKFLDLAPR